jgi:uncharacterized protein YlxW (UPF0749 family)
MSRRLPPRARARLTRPRWAISIAVALGLIGFVGAAQWNSSIARQQYISSAQAALVTQAEQQQREQEQLRAQIEEAEARVRTFQEQTQGSQSVTDRLNEQLAASRLAAGLTAVHGPGLVLEIADSQRPVPAGENRNNYLVLTDDLRDIVNALWGSGAEAITVSGERLVATSSIYGAGTAILVNYVPLSPPYRIEAIGPEGLFDRFNAHPSFVGRVSQRIEAYGLQYASEPRDDVTLPGFIGNIQLRWGVPVRDD